MLVLVIVGVLLVLAILLAWTSIKVVREYQRIVLFRMGRMVGLRGPGIVIIIPVIDRPTYIDLRESYLEIPHQTSITKDNASISIDFITFFKVVDPAASVVQVADFSGAAQNVASTTLRSVVGDITLDNLLAQRDEINHILLTKLDEVTERWGVKITNVEIREVIPPQTVLEAMTRQMSAERTRRAVVTEADGVREAAILRAEGEKQAAILQADGDRQAAVLRAQGEREAAALRAVGFAAALQTVFETARGVDDRTMSLQYLDALKALGDSPSTKFVLPLELTSMLRRISTFTEQGFGSGVPAVAPSVAPSEPSGDIDFDNI